MPPLAATALLLLAPPDATARVDPRTLAHLASAARQQGRFVATLAGPIDDDALPARLAAAGVTGVVLAGAATDREVLAAARAARALGHAVDVLADATAASTPGRHLAALRAIAALGGRVRSWAELLSEGDTPVVIAGLGAGDTALHCGALRDCIADDGRTYAALEAEVAWATMRHRGGEVPRLVAVQGARGADGVEPLYRHPLDGQPTLADWTPAVDAIRRAVEARVGHPINHGLLQLYRHGRDWISEHSDKTLDLARPSTIVNVSLGRTRTMTLRAKVGDEAPERIPLPSGSMFVMGLATNRTRYHAIRREGARDDDGPRISLTFRHIGTFHDPATGAVWGVGAPAAERAAAEERARSRRAGGVDEREEAERMVRLFREENIDPDFDAASYRPGFEVIDLRALNETE